MSVPEEHQSWPAAGFVITLILRDNLSTKALELVTLVLERLNRDLPLPYHLSFMVGLASGSLQVSIRVRRSQFELWSRILISPCVFFTSLF
jgi:hypothetical protein